MSWGRIFVQPTLTVMVPICGKRCRSTAERNTQRAGYCVLWRIAQQDHELLAAKPVHPVIAAEAALDDLADQQQTVASKSKLFALVNVRYLWEAGARAKTQGETLAVTATFPIPSVKLR